MLGLPDKVELYELIPLGLPAKEGKPPKRRAIDLRDGRIEGLDRIVGVLVIAGIVAIPGLLNDLSEAARSKYAASTLAGLDIEAVLKKLDSLMADDKIYQDEDLNLSMLAAELDVSSHQLSELITSRLGMSFSRYIRERRVDAAKKLLLAGSRQSVLSISLDTGFKSQSSFYAAFKDITGLSPELVAQAAAIARECGAPLMKLQYPGSLEGCRDVTDALGDIPWAVLSAGVDDRLLLTHVRGALEPEDRGGRGGHDPHHRVHRPRHPAR